MNRSLKGLVVGALALGTLAVASEAANATPAQNVAAALGSDTASAAAVEKVWCCRYGWRGGWGWRRPWGWRGGWGWRHPYYGYGWRRPWGWRRW